MTPDDAAIARILAATHRVAMAGASANPARPSHGVMAYLQGRGVAVIPLNPGQAGGAILGARAWARAGDIPPDAGRIDLLDIFRRSAEVPALLAEALPALVARGLHTVWMQPGVVSPEGAALARAQGLNVVMDRCLKTEWSRLGPERGRMGAGPEG